jgi:pyruvate kinase
VQKDIIVAANRRLVPVITATQMLESMVTHTRPTRAEASDVANAVWDGSDALMLSAETAIGRDPAGAVRMMDRIIRAAERQPGAFLSRVRSEHRTTEDTSGTISHAACTMAAVDPRVKAIVAFTRSGYTARLLSMDRPPVPILSISPDPAVRNRCALYWGTIAAISDESEGLLSMTITADEQARAVLGLREGDFIIIAGGWPRDLAATTNLLKVHRIGDPA